MSPARLALAAGLLAVVCVLLYARLVATKKRPLTAYGALFATGVATVGLLLVNIGKSALEVHP